MLLRKLSETLSRRKLVFRLVVGDSLESTAGVVAEVVINHDVVR